MGVIKLGQNIIGNMSCEEDYHFDLYVLHQLSIFWYNIQYKHTFSLSDLQSTATASPLSFFFFFMPAQVPRFLRSWSRVFGMIIACKVLEYEHMDTTWHDINAIVNAFQIGKWGSCKFKNLKAFFNKHILKFCLHRVVVILNLKLSVWTDFKKIVFCEVQYIFQFCLCQMSLNCHTNVMWSVLFWMSSTLCHEIQFFLVSGGCTNYIFCS